VTLKGSPARPAHALDDDHLEQGSERAEVVAVARVQRRFGRDRRSSDEEVDGSCTACLAPSGHNGSEDTAVGPGRLTIERQRIEGSRPAARRPAT
jgi:hypothetical protein